MLFLRETKKIMCSIAYVLFVVTVTFALFSQGALDFSNEKMAEPQPGGNYGNKNEEIPEIIMPGALQSLYNEFGANNYTTYPIAFYKNVKLNEEEQKRIAEIISIITGSDKSQIYSQQETSGGNGKEDLKLVVRSDISYSEFKEEMQKIDDILGGASAYAEQSLIKFGEVPVSYDEAVESYELAQKYDQVTGGYARLFSDYATAMVLSILPVFLAVIMSMKDKRAKMSELIYTRRASGVKIVLARYMSIIISVMLPVIVLSYVSSASVWGMYSGMELDYFAPLKYDLGFIMPSVMISAALGMCLTELTNTPIAVAVQGLWWFLDLNIGFQSITASYSLFRLAPRHNAGVMSFFRTQDFIDNFLHLLVNRLLFAGLSVVLVIAAIAIYEAKRKGKLNGSYKIKKIFTGIRNRKNQSEA